MLRERGSESRHEEEESLWLKTMPLSWKITPGRRKDKRSEVEIFVHVRKMGVIKYRRCGQTRSNRRQSYWFRRIAPQACITRFLGPAQSVVAASSEQKCGLKYVIWSSLPKWWELHRQNFSVWHEMAKEILKWLSCSHDVYKAWYVNCNSLKVRVTWDLERLENLRLEIK